MTSFPVALLVFGVVAVGALVPLGVALARRREAPRSGWIPWVPLATAVLVVAAPGTAGLDVVLLGTQLLLDGPSRVTVAALAALFVILGLGLERLLHASPAAAACYLLAWGAAVVQVLAGELLLFLASAAVTGYALLALTAGAWLRLGPWRLGALAVLLLAADLALLELATLLVLDASDSLHATGSLDAGDSRYAIAAPALAALRGKPLIELTLAIGFGGRMATLALIPAWARGLRGPALRVLAGWLAFAAGAVLGRWRLVADGPGDGIASLRWAADFAWAVPLVLVGLVLPWLLRAGRGLGERIGAAASSARARGATAGGRVVRACIGARAALASAEAQLLRWSLATGLAVLIAAALLLRLLA